MTTLIHDPIGLGESTVILACLILYAWWFSPRQRSQRRRAQARDRAQLRQALTRSGNGTASGVAAPSLSHDRRGRA
jgi:hypothetical protein